MALMIKLISYARQPIYYISTALKKRQYHHPYTLTQIKKSMHQHNQNDNRCYNC